MSENCGKSERPDRVWRGLGLLLSDYATYQLQLAIIRICQQEIDGCGFNGANRASQAILRELGLNL